ncbi:hypothetical protein GJAV_G00019960 [Gymnothorax javanicus]|nr:hypothetical protein GJAV_G00019960 [Gymnothorax javanicus]
MHQAHLMQQGLHHVKGKGGVKNLLKSKSALVSSAIANDLIRNALQDAGVVVSTTTIKRRLHQHHFRWFTKRCRSLDDSTSQTPDQSGMSLLQEQVRREIMQQMKFSPIADYGSMDLPSLLGIAQQELALATAISSYVNIPEELVSNLQELISRLGQSMQSAAEAPAAEAPAADSVANPPDNATIRRRLHQHNFRWLTTTCKTQDNSTQDKSGLSLLQEDVRREILQKMQTRFSSIADSETMDLEELLSIAQQELALAAATSSHVNIPEELVSNLQELICKLCQARQSDAEEPAHSSENVTDTSDDSPSSK